MPNITFPVQTSEFRKSTQDNLINQRPSLLSGNYFIDPKFPPLPHNPRPPNPLTHSSNATQLDGVQELSREAKQAGTVGLTICFRDMLAAPLGGRGSGLEIAAGLSRLQTLGQMFCRAKKQIRSH